jgi:cytochrome b involved in lipid metabolism
LTDPVITLATNYVAIDNETLVKFGLKYAGVLATTPPDRIVRAAADEIADLVRRARAAIEALPGAETIETSVREVLAALSDETTFPRDALDAIVERIRGTDALEARAELSSLATEIESWTARHRALERRVKWLLRGTPPNRRAELDPHADADELHHVLTSSFRFEARVLELLAINRVAQAANIGTFFRSTKEAELNSVGRFFDTYSLYGNVFEWGVDSFRGRGAIERMNQIHGRYYIPNDEIKFVLLQGCFTWLDGAARIGHRPVADNERRGMLASWVRMGQAMHIQELTEDFDAMYAWFRDVCMANAEFQPYKRTTFDTIVSASLSGQLPALRNGLFLAAQVAMDDTYRSATGYPEPTKEQKQAVRAVFFTVGSLIEQLPYAPYLRSLMNNPARRALTEPRELGAPERSTYMPPAFAGLPNGGFPEWQKPLRSNGDAVTMELPDITWDTVREKVAAGSIWVVVDGYVYDVTTMVEVHPGGATVLRRWAGKDATRAFRAANHSAGTLTFSLNYRIGRVVGEPPSTTRVAADAADAEEPDAAVAAGD